MIPAWMFDRTACSAMVLGAPRVSIAALREVRRMVDEIRAPMPASSSGTVALEDSNDQAKPPSRLSSSLPGTSANATSSATCRCGWFSFTARMPGHSLVVLDPALMLATHMIPREDGHAQERSLTLEILQLVEENDVWVADRNFCTATLLFGVAIRSGFFVIRHHANMELVSSGTRHQRGPTDTGEVSEESVTIEDADGNKLTARRIILRLDEPTQADARTVADRRSVASADAPR